MPTVVFRGRKNRRASLLAAVSAITLLLTTPVVAPFLAHGGRLEFFLTSDGKNVGYRDPVTFATTVIFSVAGTNTITVGGGGANDPPSGVTSLTFECWGPGGGGGGGKGAGGGAGSYASKAVICANGDVFTLTIPAAGAAGTATTAGGNAGNVAPADNTLVSRSGADVAGIQGGWGGGTNSSVASNAGGIVNGSSGAIVIGDTLFSGGKGGAGNGGGTQGGGGGGGSAGSAGNGGAGAAGSTATTTSRPAGGTAGTPDGAAGGTGGAKVSVAGLTNTGGTGAAGTAPGAGGGGGSSSQAGGAGADGQIKVTWTAVALPYFFNRQARLAYMEF